MSLNNASTSGPESSLKIDRFKLNGSASTEREGEGDDVREGEDADASSGRTRAMQWFSRIELDLESVFPIMHSLRENFYGLICVYFFLY